MLAVMFFCELLLKPFNHNKPRYPQVFYGEIFTKMNDLRLPLRRPFTAKKYAYLLVDIIMCTHLYATFTLILVIFPFASNIFAKF